MSDITEQAYEAVSALLVRTSNAPMPGEIARLVEEFALEFAMSAGLKLCSAPDSEGAVIAVRNAVGRASRGEP